MSKQYNDSLTPDQVDAITHAWLDMSTKLEINKEPFAAHKHAEVDAAMSDSVKELEKEFPFLMEPVNE